MQWFDTLAQLVASYVIVLNMLSFLAIVTGYKKVVMLPETPYERVLGAVVILLIMIAALRGVWH